MDFTGGELAILEGNAYNIGIFFQLQLSTVQRLWLGIGKIKPGINAYDPLGTEVYSGFGELVDVPAFQQLINGTAERIEFVCNGVSSKIISVAAGDAGTVRCKPVLIGIGIMDTDWRLVAPVKWCWRGVADFLTFDIVPPSDPSGATLRTLKLSVGSLLTGRRRRGLSYYTDQDQETKYPGDTFCSRAVEYNQLIQKVFPRFALLLGIMSSIAADWIGQSIC